EGGVINSERGEGRERGPAPAISAVIVAPPPIRVGAVAQAAERCNRDDLLARRRIGQPGLGGPADALRPERSRSGVAATGMGARVAYPPNRQDAAYRHSRDADGIEANPHPGRRFGRQQGCQNKYGNAGKSNAPLPHGTLPRKARRATPGTSLGIDDAQRNRKFHTERGIAPKTGNNQVGSKPLRARRPASFGGNSSRTAGYARPQAAGGLAARLLRGLRPARQLHQHSQRLHDRSFAHGNATDGAKT